MSGFNRARTILKTLRDANAWKPASFGALSGGLVHRNRNALLGISEQEHLVAAAEWLARAQDAQSDGGVSGRFLVGRGWSSSYPETTGYIVPTFLALESEAGMAGYRARAQRCIEFLLGVQLPSGAFPGLEIAENRDQPSIFNSAQILNGLTAWHAATGDDTTLRAARRAADWLVGVQDDDGAWRKHLYGSGKTYTYMAHAACWIAEFGDHVGDARYLDAARRHLEWVLTHVDDATGWIEDCGFEAGGPPGTRDAVTHTIAYTIWGVLFMSRVLGHERGMSAARRAALAVARRVGISKWLPGRLDARWKGTTTYACLTGNAQMALIWLELHRLESDPALVSAAFTVLDLVKRAQFMRSTEPGLRGGVGGSDPLWGGYIRLAVPNWAAKFFVDALLAKGRVLATMTDLPVRGHDTATEIPPRVPRALPAASNVSSGVDRPRVVLLADEHGHKVEQFLAAWSSWGFRPDGVVVRRLPEASALERMRMHVRDRGLLSVARRVLGARTGQPTNGSAMRASTGRTAGTVGTHSGTPVSAFCAARGIPTVIVESRDDPADVERVRALRPDLFVYAGYGILRARMLGVAPLGTLNAHMGILPPVRGMNAAEWSAFTGTPVGCTIHLIDTGIDTGDIVLVEPVDAVGADSIGELRDRVDLAQVDALGQVVRWVIENGKLPPTYAQRADEGRQYFPMHPEMREILEAHLGETAAVNARTR